MFILIVSQRDISSSLLWRMISIFDLLCAFFASLGGLKIFPEFCNQLRNLPVVLLVHLFENPFSMSFDTDYVLLDCYFHASEPASRSFCSGYLKGHSIQVSFLKHLFFSSEELISIAKRILCVIFLSYSSACLTWYFFICECQSCSCWSWSGLRYTRTAAELMSSAGVAALMKPSWALKFGGCLGPCRAQRFLGAETSIIAKLEHSPGLTK